MKKNEKEHVLQFEKKFFFSYYHSFGFVFQRWFVNFEKAIL
jgi:hypothetical protein